MAPLDEDDQRREQDMRDGASITTLVLAMACLPAPLLADDAAALPGNLEAMIMEKIAAVSAGEKAMIAGWTAGKKLAEFFCREIALAELGKTYPGSDRVFLSMSDDAPPGWVAQDRVAGRGSVRHDAGWTDISYECEVDLRTGQPRQFTYRAEP